MLEIQILITKVIKKQSLAKKTLMPCLPCCFSKDKPISTAEDAASYLSDLRKQLAKQPSQAKSASKSQYNSLLNTLIWMASTTKKEELKTKLGEFCTEIRKALNENLVAGAELLKTRKLYNDLAEKNFFGIAEFPEEYDNYYSDGTARPSEPSSKPPSYESLYPYLN